MSPMSPEDRAKKDERIRADRRKKNQYYRELYKTSKLQGFTNVEGCVINSDRLDKLEERIENIEKYFEEFKLWWKKNRSLS